MKLIYCYCFINLLIISVFHSLDARLLEPRSVEELKYEYTPSESNNLNKLIAVKSPRTSRFLDERPENLLLKPMGFSRNSFPPSNLVAAESKNDAYAKFIRWKGDSSVDHDKFRTRYWGKRKKEILRKPVKRYLDYTNSQMPFNEGRKASKFTQIEKAVTKNEPNESSNLEGIGGLEDELPEGYSRVRRFLDHERVKKRARLSNTLEAKEAAMSRVLDPNLNLDGILEPHVRKRRARRFLRVSRTPKRGIRNAD